MSGRIRTIKPELLEDAVTAGISHAAFRLYVGSILIADDYGNLRADPRKLRGDVFWAHDDVTTEFVESLLVELWRAGREDKSSAESLKFGRSGLLYLYTARGQRYGHIRNWEKHQKVERPGKPRCTPPDDEESVEYRPTPDHSQSYRRDVGDDSRLTSDLRPGPRPGPPTVGFGNPTTLADVPVQSNRDGAILEATDSDLPTEPSRPEAPMPTAGQFTLSPRQPELVLATGDAAQRVHEHYVAAWKRHIGGVRPPKLDEKRRRAIRDRLRERFTVEELCRACDGIFLSAFHMGQNDRGKRFTDLELVCRSAKHVEEFMALADAGVAVSVPPAEDSNVEPITLTPEQREAAAGRLRTLFPDLDATIDAIGGAR